jgi:hypothetical protein
MKRPKLNKTKPLRPADFPPPKRVSQEKVSEICESQGISDHSAVGNHLNTVRSSF